MGQQDLSILSRKGEEPQTFVHGRNKTLAPQPPTAATVLYGICQYRKRNAQHESNDYKQLHIFPRSRTMQRQWTQTIAQMQTSLRVVLQLACITVWVVPLWHCHTSRRVEEGSGDVQGGIFSHELLMPFSCGKKFMCPN